MIETHHGSIRVAAIRRRLNQERSAISDGLRFLGDIHPILPESFEGDAAAVTWRDVLDGKIPFARLAVGGKVTAKNAVVEMVASVEEQISVSRKVIAELNGKLKRLGITIL